MPKSVERWWIVNIRTARKRNREITVRADTEADARVLACPNRGDTITSVAGANAFRSRIYAMFKGDISQPAIFEALGDCASLLKVGVPFQDAIRLQFPRIASPALRYELFMVVKALVTQGVGVPEAFRGRPRICDASLESMIRVGFESGSMVQSFQDMREKTRKDRRLTSKIRGALMQPAITILFLLVLVCFFSVIIIPKVEGIYVQFKAPLPLFSQPTFYMAGILREFAIVTIPAMFAVPILLWIKRADLMRKKWVREMVFSLPMFGNFFSMVDLIDGVRNLSILLRTGVPLNDALRLTAPGLANPSTRAAWEAINMDITHRGVDASIAFEKYAEDLGSEGAAIAAIVRIGEQGTNLPKLLTEKAADYTAEVDERSEDVVKMIGPLVNVIIFTAAGYLLMSTYMPILKLNSLITGMKQPTTQKAPP